MSAPAGAVRLEGGERVDLGAPLLVRVDDPSGDTVFVVDGIDVSGFAQRDGDSFVLDVPLDAGPHTLVVVKNGWRREIFDFVVVEPRVFSGETSLALNGEVTYRLSEHSMPPPPELDRAEGRSSIQWRTDFEYGPWQGSAFVPLLYESAGKETGTGRHWDLANFLGTLERGPFLLQAGEHSAGVSSLILQGFRRRGFSLHTTGPKDTFLTGFVFHTEPTTGFRERMGISDPTNRLWGVSLGSERVGLGPLGELFVATSFLRAAGGEGGAGTAGLGLERGTEHGHAIDGTFEFRMFEGAVVIGGDYARTQFDFDGGGGAGSESDDAWLFYAEFTPLDGVELGGHPVDVRFAYEEGERGPFFRSLGNAGAPTDLHDASANLDLGWAGLAASLSWARVEDNVDDEEFVTTFGDETWSVDLAYTPVVQGEPAWQRYLGTPTLQAGWSRHRVKPIDNFPGLIQVYDSMGMPTMLVEPEPLYNATARTSYVAARTSFRRWSVGTSYTKRHFDQRANSNSDTISRSFSWQLDMTPHTRVSLSLDGSRESSTRRDPSFKTVSKRVGLSTRLKFLEGKVDGSFRADWRRLQDSLRFSDERDLLLSTQATWRVRAPQEMQPGVSLSLLGTYRDVIDEAQRSNSLDGYQVFLKMDIVWSPRHSWGDGRTR